MFTLSENELIERAKKCKKKNFVELVKLAYKSGNHDGWYERAEKREENHGPRPIKVADSAVCTIKSHLAHDDLVIACKLAEEDDRSNGHILRISTVKAIQQALNKAQGGSK